ncbi:protein mono-ADP-ribosyltransferase PARP16 [Lasioglossum baleicum]|uniref:protein mono-ADP-ribosyltransferase PARP16 n=1 Tax=Lasioglossum baleicum TaxID=434251 RepID=UPI003FCCDB18
MIRKPFFNPCIMMNNSHEQQYIHNGKERENHVNIMDSEINTGSDVTILYTNQLDSVNEQEEIINKVSSLKYLLENDLKGADLKWSLFVAACNTYRYNTCLKPFPPMYMKKKCKDIDALRRAIELIPPLTVILKALQEPDVYERHGTTIDLLYWVLIHLRDPYIKSISKDHYKAILKKVPSEISLAAPNLIFQVAKSRQSASEEKWKSIAQDCRTFYAYHGSRLENFHSIIHYGLQQSMCKRSLFGEGIYLSSELGVSLPYSRVGYGWGGSILGSEMSCIALCELVNHVDVRSSDTELVAETMARYSLGGRVPNKYYLVTNSELVRVRYLLVYSQEVHTTRSINNRGLLAWFKQHTFLTCVLGYVVLLTSVGLTQFAQKVENVDQEDHKNPALVSIYIDEIYKYLRTLESKYCVKEGYLKGQEVTPKMRSILVDWLIEVHQHFCLLQETLYLTVAIIDRFLQAFHSIDKKRLQLVGITAMFIARKYEETVSPNIDNLVYITDDSYTKKEIFQMEVLIMKTLDYSLGRPLPLHFLRRYSKERLSLCII